MEKLNNFTFSMGSTLGLLTDAEIIKYLKLRGITDKQIEILGNAIRDVGEAFYREPKGDSTNG